ncbi:MAG: UDP-N-acetylmuramate dehydrogenase [Flavobacteriales bacterium]
MKQMHFERYVDLKPFNTFGISAEADALGWFADVDALRGMLDATKGLKRLVLGGGSNILLTQDFKGVVLVNELPGMELLREDEENVWVRAGAGLVWHDLVVQCVRRGWGGIENMSLIPGKVGAAPMQNIGAYGVELKDVFHDLQALRIEDGEHITFDKAACAFGYRESFFKREGRDRFVILNVTLRLSKRPEVNTSYGNIQQELDKRGIASPTIADVSDAVIAIRRSKLPDPAVIGNAGSFFKNPIVTAEVATRIRTEHPDMPGYPVTGHSANSQAPAVKLAAGWLIEKAGWKGYREGAFGVHAAQALVLVNHGGAKGKDIFNLSTRIVEDVKQRFGVELEREVNIL